MGFMFVRIKMEHILLIYFVTSPMKRILPKMSKTYVVLYFLTTFIFTTDISLEGGAKEFYYLQHLCGG